MTWTIFKFDFQPSTDPPDRIWTPSAAAAAGRQLQTANPIIWLLPQPLFHHQRRAQLQRPNHSWRKLIIVSTDFFYSDFVHFKKPWRCGQNILIVILNRVLARILTSHDAIIIYLNNATLDNWTSQNICTESAMIIMMIITENYWITIPQC